MPPPYVKTIREEIFYEYAKLISRSAYGSLQRAFIAERFKKLRDGKITISGTIREWGRKVLKQKEKRWRSTGRKEANGKLKNNLEKIRGSYKWLESKKK